MNGPLYKGLEKSSNHIRSDRRPKKHIFQPNIRNMGESFQDYSWIQDSEADFP